MPCCLVYMIKVRKSVGVYEVKYSSAIKTLHQGYIKNSTLTQHIINSDFDQMDHPSCRTPHISHIAQLGQRMNCGTCCRAHVLTVKQQGKKTTKREKVLAQSILQASLHLHCQRVWKEQNLTEKERSKFVLQIFSSGTVSIQERQICVR